MEELNNTTNQQELIDTQLTLERCVFEMHRFTHTWSFISCPAQFKPMLFKGQLAIGNSCMQRVDCSHMWIFSCTCNPCIVQGSTIQNTMPNKSRIHIFSRTHGTFTKIDHILSHETNLNKFKRIRSYRAYFITIVEGNQKLTTENKRNVSKYMKLNNNTLLNNPLAKQEVSKEI